MPMPLIWLTSLLCISGAECCVSAGVVIRQLWKSVLNHWGISPAPFFPQLVKMAKRLKKEKVSVDIINFGEEVSWRPYALIIPYCNI